MNDVRTKKIRTYNFVSGPLRASRFNIPTRPTFCAGQRASSLDPPKLSSLVYSYLFVFTDPMRCERQSDDKYVGLDLHEKYL